MKRESHKIKHNCILTKDSTLVEGGEYLYTEGSVKKKTILEEVVENGEWLRLKIYFPDEERHIEISHINADVSYMGMWRLYDWDDKLIEEIEEAEKLRKELIENFSPEVKHRKIDFLNSLSIDDLANIHIHFNTIYECKELTEHEKNIVWLSWLLGEGLLMVSDGFLMYEMSEVEFEHTDYEVTFEAEPSGGVNIDLFRDYYELDKLYTEVLKDKRKQ